MSSIIVIPTDDDTPLDQETTVPSWVSDLESVDHDVAEYGHMPTQYTVIWSSDGTYTFDVPGLTVIDELYLSGGGGGAGGSGAGWSSAAVPVPGYDGTASGSSGGNGGSGFQSTIYNLAVVMPIQVVVGSSGMAGGGGTFPCGNGRAGSAGGTSRFGSYASANGGGGGGAGTGALPPLVNPPVGANGTGGGGRSGGTAAGPGYPDGGSGSSGQPGYVRVRYTI